MRIGQGLESAAEWVRLVLLAMEWGTATARAVCQLAEFGVPMGLLLSTDRSG